MHSYAHFLQAICLESMLKREKETYSSLTIIEKRKLELEDSINKLAEICTSNVDTLKKTLDDLHDVTEQISQINVFLEDEAKVEVDEKILMDKIF